MRGLVLRSGRAGVSKLMGRWSLCFPQLAGEYKARQTPAVQNTASSWDRGPKEHSGRIREAPNGNLRWVRRGVFYTKKGQGKGVYSLAWDLRTTRLCDHRATMSGLNFQVNVRLAGGLLEEANPDYTKTLQQGKLGNPSLQWLELRITQDPGEVPG